MRGGGGGRGGGGDLKNKKIFKTKRFYNK